MLSRKYLINWSYFKEKLFSYAIFKSRTEIFIEILNTEVSFKINYNLIKYIILQ